MTTRDLESRAPDRAPPQGTTTVMPKVTAIIPNYNHARFLPRRLASVLGQTFGDLEILFLDDCSTDDSRAVFERCAAHDPRVRAIFNDRNSGGVFRQWNRGLKEARGEYVWIAESDDYADDRLVEELVDRLDARPNVGLAYAQSWIVDQDDNATKTYERMNDNIEVGRWSTDFVNDGRDECRRCLVRHNTIPNASAVLLRKSVLDRVGPAPEDLKLGGDWLMWARVLAVSDVAFAARPLNYHRVHTGTVRKASLRDGLDIEEMARVQAEIARLAGLNGRERAELARSMAWTWLVFRNGSTGEVERARFPIGRNLRILRTMAGVHPISTAVVAAGLAREALRGLGLRGPSRGASTAGAVAASTAGTVGPVGPGVDDPAVGGP